MRSHPAPVVLFEDLPHRSMQGRTRRSITIASDHCRHPLEAEPEWLGHIPGAQPALMMSTTNQVIALGLCQRCRSPRSSKSPRGHLEFLRRMKLLDAQQLVAQAGA